MSIFLMLLTFAQTFKDNGKYPERDSQNGNQGVVTLLLTARVPFTKFETHLNHVNEHIKLDEINAPARASRSPL